MKTRRIATIVAACTLVFAACGDDDSGDDDAGGGDETTTSSLDTTETEDSESDSEDAAEGSEPSESEETTGSGGGSGSNGGDEQAYADALAASLLASQEDSPLQVTEDQAQCFGDDAARIIGGDRLTQLGPADEVAQDTDPDFVSLGLSADEADEVASALIDCTPGFVQAVRDSFTEQTAADPEITECVNGIFDSDGEEIVRDAFAAGIVGEDADAVFIDAFAPCGPEAAS